MKLPAKLIKRLSARCRLLVVSREPDFVVGAEPIPYLLRWFIIPRNRLLNIYLHVFKRSDDDRALHDHPWFNASILLRGEYTEHTIAAGGIHRRVVRGAGDVAVRGPRVAHRIELHAGDCMTLFITGPRLRDWGFHCAQVGWIPWQKFTKPGRPGETGPGCEQ